MRFSGTLKTWHDDRGFGFIEATKGGQALFVHIKDFPSGSGRPCVGQILNFEVETRPDGKKKARDVRFPVRSKNVVRARSEESAPWSSMRLAAIPCFVALYLYLSMRWGFSLGVLLAYFGLSLVTFMLYALDKSAAVMRRWRTAEKTLHLWSLIGGWPGALLAQQLLRHKTSKQSFIVEYWLCVALNWALLVAWYAGVLPLPRPPGVV